MAAGPALRRAALIVGLAIASAAAGEPADPVLLRMADGATLQSHWQASLFGPWWSDPGMNQVREALGARCERIRVETGRDPLDVLVASRGVQLRILGPLPGPRRLASWGIQADLGTQAPQLARKLAALGDAAQRAEVSGADEGWTLPQGSLARFGGIVALGRPASALPLVPVPGEADLAIDIAVPALQECLRRLLRPGDLAATQPYLDLVRPLHGVRLRADLVPSGLNWSCRLDGALAWLRPADCALPGRLPAGTMWVEAIGIRGVDLWTAWGASLEAAIASSGSGARLDRAGLDEATRRTLITALDGTAMLAVTPGAPVPGITVVVPRSPQLDALVAAWCAKQSTQLPADGVPSLLNLPDLPMAVQLVVDPAYWLLTTDAVVASTWRTLAGGFATTPTGAGLAEAPAGACVLGATDASALLRLLMGPLQQALVMEPQLTPVERTAALMASARLAAILPPGRHWGTAAAGKLELTGHGGDPTWVAAGLGVALGLLPELIGSNMQSNEIAAAAILRSQIFPAQVQFQAGGYQDGDGDACGEYGLLSEIGGRRATKIAAGGLQLLNGPLAELGMTETYQFACWLPDGAGGAIGEPDGPVQAQRPALPAACDTQEKAFVAYAWPRSEDDGGKVFALDQSGQVHVRPWDGKAPHWNDLYGGGGWDAQPAWKLWQRPRRMR